MCQTCAHLEKTKPFSYHRPSEQTEAIFVGPHSQKLLQRFEREGYAHAMVNSIMTAIVGPPGTGKTHFLYHLRHRSRTNQRQGTVLIVELKSQQATYTDLINAIYTHPELRKYCSDRGVELAPATTPHEAAQSISKAIAACRTATRSPQDRAKVGMVLAIDAVDEYIRKVRENSRRSGQPLTERQVVDNLLGACRLLLDAIPHLCVTLALTTDASLVIEESLRDPTLARRFRWVTDAQGNRLQLEPGAPHLTRDEGTELVRAYLNHWRSMTGQEAAADALAPFTKEAVELFSKAATIRGDFCMACILAIEHKLVHGHPDDDHLKITATDAAWVLRTYSNYFEDLTAVNDELDELLVGRQRDETIGQLKRKARVTVNDPRSAFVEALESAVVTAYARKSRARALPGGRNKLVRPRFQPFTTLPTLDVLLEYEGVRVAFQIHDEATATEGANAVETALRNGIADAAVVVAFEKDRTKVSWDPPRRRVEAYSGEVDYTPRITRVTLPAGARWWLIGLKRGLVDNPQYFEKFSKYSLDAWHFPAWLDRIARAESIDVLKKQREEAERRAWNLSPFGVRDNPAGWLQDYFR